MAVTGVRPVRLWSPRVVVDTRDDGSIVVAQADPLGTYPVRLSDRIARWATIDPHRAWMAERSEGEGWRRVSYGELHEQTRRIGSFLSSLQLSAERPLLILSENSLEHAIIALSAQYAGIPSAAISPAYSLADATFAKLRDVSRQITPGAVFVQDVRRFEPAIRAVFAPTMAVITVDPDGHHLEHPVHLWSEIRTSAIDAAVEDANAATGPHTIAKFLFTSGTTGSPKAVIQTQQMLCSNMEMVRDCFRFVEDDPPILVDWAPWNHVASGNMVFNFALYNGGTYYIDGGKPTPQGIGETIKNLREISPNWYFNVPLGFELLCEAMQNDPDLADKFFRNLKMIMYAGAGMARHTWDCLNALSVHTMGERVLMCTGLGATETAPFALFCTEPQDAPGNVGIPMRGVTAKLVPTGEKLELRVKGPSITPGYWREPKLTASVFDDEGFYKMGDALRPADPSDLTRGFLFDGRTAENFKLRTGTWVAAGPLRARLVDAMGGLAQDAAICGEDRHEVGALIVPQREKVALLVTGSDQLSDEELFNHPAVLAEFERRLKLLASTSTGSSNRVARAVLLTTPPDSARGEITEKGSLNQKALLANRSQLVEDLFAGGPGVLLAYERAREEEAR